MEVMEGELHEAGKLSKMIHTALFNISVTKCSSSLCTCVVYL